MDVVKVNPRRKVKVRIPVVEQAITHLGNFLTITTTMSQRACSLAATPEGAAAARKQFMQLFGEIAATMAALDEAAHPDAGQATAELLAGIKQSTEYKSMLAAMQHDRINECYVFEGGTPTKAASAQHADELCFEVALRHPCRDFGGWLLGKLCSIDGVSYAVMAVEYAPLKPPFEAGAKVRLVVRAVADDGTVADKPKGETHDAPGPGAESHPPSQAACATRPAEAPAEGAPA